MKRKTLPGMMETRPLTRRILRIVALVMIPYLVVAVTVFCIQRSLLFLPTHVDRSTRLVPWVVQNRTIGYCREVADAPTIWLMTHGNAGQAADRDYVLSRMSDQDSLYVLEYPGYGSRPGSPCLESINQAAVEAYRVLRAKHRDTPVCVLGESIGSGPACSLAQEETPPDKIILVVPFDSLVNLASRRFFFLPVRLLLLDNWNNVETLRHYPGPIEIFGAISDEVIPVEHAKSLAAQVPAARFTPIRGGHNDWSWSEKVKIRR